VGDEGDVWAGGEGLHLNKTKWTRIVLATTQLPSKGLMRTGKMSSEMKSLDSNYFSISLKGELKKLEFGKVHASYEQVRRGRGGIWSSLSRKHHRLHMRPRIPDSQTLWTR